VRRLIYNLAKFVVVFLSVSIVFTIAAQLMPRYRPQLEYVGIAALAVAEIWVFSRRMKWRFSTRTLLIVTAIESAILGAFTALKK
jgi:cytochrome c biogenesis protein CcdA